VVSSAFPATRVQRAFFTGRKMTPIEFARAYPNRQNTICSEMVVAWAERKGRAPVSRFRQLRLWKKLGCENGAEQIAEYMKLTEISPDQAEPGDAVLLRCEDGATVLGLNLGKFCVIAGFGQLRIGRFKICRAWAL
jgi:hypothetical protein